MHVIEANNVRDAFLETLNYLIVYGGIEDSRIGKVTAAPEPVTIHYAYPKKHVLLNPVRDANPFFHLMEAMWMLAGRDDSAFLDYYIKDFGKKFGKDGIVMDAYGQRWRYGNRYDQLNAIVNLLRSEPTSRQAVLQMWGAGRDDLRAYSSKPCNLVVSFRIQNGQLNMTVFNRSNDMIWGCCGSNAVHFPILQEYLAGRIGVELGEYWQISTNLHMYVDAYNVLCKRCEGQEPLDQHQPEEYGKTMPLMELPLEFDEDLAKVMAFIDEMHKGYLPILDDDISNPFLSQVVIRMAMAHFLYKNNKMNDALDIIESVTAEDWRIAGREWITRRLWQKQQKTNASA